MLSHLYVSFHRCTAMMCQCVTKNASDIYRLLSLHKHTEILYFTVYVNYEIFARTMRKQTQMAQPESSREIHVTLTLLYKFKIVGFLQFHIRFGLYFTQLHLQPSRAPEQIYLTILCQVGSLKQSHYNPSNLLPLNVCCCTLQSNHPHCQILIVGDSF